MDHEIGLERTPFIGRGRERSFLVDELKEGTRLLTITGPSGMGKTRLARQVMEELAPAFADLGGVHFCSLAACQTASDLETAVALSLPPRRRDETAPKFAGKGPTLLVLDNVDSLARLASPVVGALLDRLGDLQLLLTSLEPLGMREEVRFELGPMETRDAIALYRDRIHRAWAERDGADDDALLTELVRRLDRSPLAIELAAARVRVMPPRALLSRIDARFELLQGDRAGRHGSLFKALSISWDLLEPEEKLGLARISVFAGGFSLEAARAVLLEPRPGEAGQEPADVLKLLDGLRNKAFLQLDERRGPRFSVYESVRDFSAIHLQRLEAEEESVARHTRFFLENAERHAAMIEGPACLPSIRWLMDEHENLLAALRRNIDAEPLVAARIGAALATVIELQGSPSSELELLELVVRAARAADAPPLLIRALRRRADALARHGRPAEAREDLAEALELARASGERREEGYIVSALGPLRAGAGEHELSVAEQEQALAIGREEGDPILEAFALLGLGVIEVSRSSFGSAEAFLERALAISRRNGHLQMEARSLLNLGVVRANQRRFREARELMREARARFQALGHRAAEAYVLLNLGGFEFAAGFLDEAEDLVEKAFRLEGAHSNRSFEAQGIVTLGLISLERGDLALARERLLEAVAMHGKNGDRTRLVQCLAYLAAADALLDRSEEARQSLEEARTFFREVGDAPSLAGLEVLEGLFEVARARRLRTNGREAEAAALEDQARARLASATASEGGDGRLLATAVRILAKALETPRRAAAPAGQGERLLLGKDASWFELASAERVDLRRRHALRRILRGLAEQRLSAPGGCLSSDDLFELGWRGEVAPPLSAARRVYTAIWALRSMGLTAAILRDGDGEGYLIDPKLVVVWA